MKLLDAVCKANERGHANCKGRCCPFVYGPVCIVAIGRETAILGKEHVEKLLHANSMFIISRSEEQAKGIMDIFPKTILE